MPCICLISDLHTCSPSFPSAWHAENNHTQSPTTAANITSSFEFPYQSAFAMYLVLAPPSRLSSCTKMVSKLIFQKSSYTTFRCCSPLSTVTPYLPAASSCSAPTKNPVYLPSHPTYSGSSVISNGVGVITTPEHNQFDVFGMQSKNTTANMFKNRQCIYAASAMFCICIKINL